MRTYLLVSQGDRQAPGVVRYIEKARATLAQSVERLIRNQQVSGSIPEGGSTRAFVPESPISLFLS